MTNITIYLRELDTGITGEYCMEWDFGENGGDIFFAWSDGNYGCDCNRGLFLHGDWDYPCNAGINSIVVDKIVRDDTGEIVYSESYCS